MAFFNGLKIISKPRCLAAAAVGCRYICLNPSALRYLKSKSPNNANFHNVHSRFYFRIPGWWKQVPKDGEVSVRVGERQWEMREDEEGIYLRLECPRADEKYFEIIKEGEGTLFLRGDVLDESGVFHKYVMYGGRLNLNLCDFDLDSITVVNIVDGVVYVVVPKKKNS